MQIGFSWNTLDEQWLEMYELLKDYKEANGHCKVPTYFITKNNKKLGFWVSTFNSVQVSRLRSVELRRGKQDSKFSVSCCASLVARVEPPAADIWIPQSAI